MARFESSFITPGWTEVEFPISPAVLDLRTDESTGSQNGSQRPKGSNANGIPRQPILASGDADKYSAKRRNEASFQGCRRGQRVGASLAIFWQVIRGIPLRTNRQRPPISCWMLRCLSSLGGAVQLRNTP
jgi:hypothetical protein